MKLKTLLKIAIDANEADQIDIDYEHGETVVYTKKDNSGISIAKLTSEQWKEISSELSGILKSMIFIICIF